METIRSIVNCVPLTYCLRHQQKDEAFSNIKMDVQQVSCLGLSHVLCTSVDRQRNVGGPAMHVVYSPLDLCCTQCTCPSAVPLPALKRAISAFSTLAERRRLPQFAVYLKGTDILVDNYSNGIWGHTIGKTYPLLRENSLEFSSWVALHHHRHVDFIHIVVFSFTYLVLSYSYKALTHRFPSQHQS